ncbi:S-transferase DHAR2 [Seminavis robusta]|uniref:S-transferase DHAR2 n=1 Tax=Seminavis robusta TaxID=568900 RepID=A0A9N8HEA4_9STRA|nr:S-transferase DHAR2 [Seminavis robusta]|eukprot:Sro395_g134100.1 S-transferase DHAR2 (273) ;mRNA; r:44115-45035
MFEFNALSPMKMILSGSQRLAAVFVLLWSAIVSAFVPVQTTQLESFGALHMAGGGMMDVANFATQQAPQTTKFVTNKMCPFAQKVWIALEASGAPYELEEVSLYGPNGKPDWFWELNPSGTVPVLVCHGGATVYPDSDLALDVIEDGSAIVGVTLNDKVKLDNSNKKLQAQIQEWRQSMLNDKLLPIGKKAVLGGSKQKLYDVLQEMNGKVVGPFLCGEQLTSADCAVFPFLWRLDNEYGMKKYPKLSAWLKHCNNHMAFSKTVQSAWWWWW